MKTDLAQGERVGQGGELLRAPRRCALGRLFPADEDVVLAQAFAAAKVGVAGLMQSHEAIDAAAQQRSHGKEGAESAVAQNDVPLAEMRPELPKELTFMHAQGAAEQNARALRF